MPPQIPIHLNFDSMAEQIGKLVGAPAGVGAGAAGASGRGGVRGMAATGLMGPEGKRMETVGRGLGQIAKQLPGAGIFGDMAGAMKKGGVMGAGMAGIAGIMGFVKQILQSSKVFQGIAGSFFKIFGAMADVFLLPFLPLAMKGMNELMKYLPMISKKGQEMADRMEEFFDSVQGNKLGAFFKRYVVMPIFEALNKLASKVTGGSIAAKQYSYNIETGEIESELEEGVIESGVLRTSMAVGKALGPSGEEIKEDWAFGMEEIKAMKTMEGWFGKGGILRPPTSPKEWQEHEDMKERLGPKWRELQNKQLGGLVSGIHQGGVGGGRSSSGLHEVNTLRNIRGKSMDVITGIGEDVRQLGKDTGTYVDSSARDFQTISTGFIGGIRQSMNSATSNVKVLEKAVEQVVIQTNNDVTNMENYLISIQQIVANEIMAMSHNLTTEIQELEDEANAQRNSILDKAIYFNDIVGTWVSTGGEEEGLSSAELKELSGKLQTRTTVQEGVEQRQREEEERKRQEEERRKKEEELRKIEEEKQRKIEEQRAKDEEEARKQEEYRINTMTSSPMFKSWAAMQRKLESLQERLAQQNATKASLRANSDRVQSPEVMEAWVGPLSDHPSAVYLQKQRRQQYWSGVVMPAQDAYQRMSETTSQTKQDIRNVQNWIANKHIPSVWSNYLGRIYENQGNIASHQRSNLNYDAGGIVEGDIGEPRLIWAQGGEQISPIGMPKNGGGGNTSNRVLNISIQTKSSVKDILIDLANLKALDNASLFNSVW